MSVGHYPLIGDVISIEGTRAYNWMLSGVSSLFYGCHSPVWGSICSPLVGVEAPRSVSELRREVGGTRVLPLGEELPRIPRHALCGVASRLMCAFTTCTLVGTDPGPSSPTGMQAVGSHSHQHSSDGTDPLKLGTRTCHSCVYSHTWPHCGSCRVSPVSSCTCTCAHLQSLQLLVPDLHTHRSTSNSLGCPEGAELTEAPAPKSSKDIRDKARISTPPPHVGRPQALAHCQTSWRRSYTCLEYLRKRVRLLCGALIAGQSPAFAHPCLRPGPRCRLSLGSKPQSFPQGSPLKLSFSTQPLCTPAEDSHLGPGSAVRWSGPSVLALLGSVCHKPVAALFSEPPEGPVCPG